MLCLSIYIYTPFLRLKLNEKITLMNSFMLSYILSYHNYIFITRNSGCLSD